MSRWVFPASDPANGGRPGSGHDPLKAAQERMATMHEKGRMPLWRARAFRQWMAATLRVLQP
ncbi:MAG: hypothetical protein ACR2M3_18335 [Thermomicrobiales bacterium]